MRCTRSNGLTPWILIGSATWMMACSLRDGAFVARQPVANGSLDCAVARGIEAGYSSVTESTGEYVLAKTAVEFDHNTTHIYQDFLILRIDSGPPAMLEVYATAGYERRIQPTSNEAPEWVQGYVRAATPVARATAREIAHACGESSRD
jgi:hypothetical protein